MKLVTLLLLSISWSANAQEIIRLGTFRAEKVSTIERININRTDVSEIRIIGEDEKVLVENARIFTNRGSESLYSLERRELRQRDVVRARTDLRDYIEVLELQVVTPSLIGSRGKYSVEIVVDRFRPRPIPPTGPLPPERPRPPQPPRGPDYGAYDPAEAREVYNQIVSFSNDRAGLNLTRRESEANAREWTRRGRICGSSWEIDRMFQHFYRRADRYRRQRYPDFEARQYALDEVRSYSRCSDILRVN